MSELATRRSPRLLYNPFDPAMRIDPYPHYHRLRESEPVHRSPLGFWVLSTFDDVVAAQRDPRLGLFSPTVESTVRSLSESKDGSPLAAVARRWLLLTNPEQHRRFRAVTGKLFAPRALQAARPGIQATVAALLEELPVAGSIDLVRDFARPLAIRAMTDLLGLPAEHLSDYTRWSYALARVLESVVDLETIQELGGAMIECADHMHGLLANRRQLPGGGMLSALMSAEHEGRAVSDDEVVAYVSLLLGAAAETTSNLVGNALLALLSHPDQLRLLRGDPRLVANAIDELVRFDAPAQLLGRWTMQDIEVRGRSIDKGSKIILLIGSANRDPARFADPDRLDLRRKDVRSASFGGGAHYCLGAGFARIEGQLALPMLLERYPRLGPIADGPRWREGHIALRSLETLVVCLQVGGRRE